MPHRLIVHESFFNSPELPERCIFSGRTHGIVPRVYFLRERIKGNFFRGTTEYRSLPIMLPAAPGRRLFWETLRGLRQLFLVLAIAFGAITFVSAWLAIFSHPITPPDRVKGFAVALAAALATAACLLVARAISRGITRFCIRSADGLIAVDFPDRLDESFQIYVQAARAFASSGKMPTPEVLPGDETWSDAVSSGWDRS
ncbi:MAG: hypothetical protein ACREJ2_03620 [Planctomycetota bacterium]